MNRHERPRVRVTTTNLDTGATFTQDLHEDEWVVVSGPAWRLHSHRRVPLRGDVVIRLIEVPE